MRIIAGALRSRTLKTVEGEGYRPAMSRVRESLFSMLDARLPAWEGLQVLDLFAGSGSLAFEALSRGAERAWLVENSAKALRCLEDNVERLDLAGRALLCQDDCLKLLRRVRGTGRNMGGPFGLVFSDPPYRKRLAQASLDALCTCGWLKDGAFVVLEIEKGLELALPQGLGLFSDKCYGQTRVLAARWDAGQAGAAPPDGTGGPAEGEEA